MPRRTAAAAPASTRAESSRVAMKVRAGPRRLSATLKSQVKANMASGTSISASGSRAAEWWARKTEAEAERTIS